MMKKILTSLVLLSLICVVLVGAETSGLSTTSSSPAPKPVCAGLGENVYDMDSKGPTSCCSGLVLKLCTGTCTPSILGTCEKACEGVDEVYQLAADMGGAGFVFTGDNDADIMHNSGLINMNVLDESYKRNVNKIGREAVRDLERQRLLEQEQEQTEA